MQLKDVFEVIVCDVMPSPDNYQLFSFLLPLSSTWPHLNSDVGDVGVEEGEY